MSKYLKQGIIIALVAMAMPSYAQDRVFTRTYQSSVLPKGVRDLENWVTYRYGRERFYSRIDHRLELEFGVCKNLQTSFYVNSSFYSYTNPLSATILNGHEFSISNEWKWKISDPNADILGSALYGEFTLAPNEYELEVKVIIDKNFGKNMLAFNAVGEMEIEPEPEWNATGDEEIELEVEAYKLNLNLGYMYRCTDKFGVGIEMENRNSFMKGLQYAALYAGPTLFFNASNWWITLNAMPQLVDLKNNMGDLELSSNEKIDMRLILSWTL